MEDNPDNTSETAYFRDKLTQKKHNTLRIGFLNINGLPNTRDHTKNRILFEYIEDQDLDLLGMAETNKCWHTLPQQDSWKNRTIGWWKASKTTLAYNSKYIIPKKFQPGGTLQVANGKATNRVIESGIDTKNLEDGPGKDSEEGLTKRQLL